MKLVTIILYLLVAIFVLILGQFFVPPIKALSQGSMLFLVPFAIFSLLGLALIITTKKQNTKGKIRKFLLLTGGSAAGFFVSIVLHNFFYALGELTEKIIVLHYLFEFLHAAFFLIGLFACPLGFIIGNIGFLILLAKKKKLNLNDKPLF